VGKSAETIPLRRQHAADPGQRLAQCSVACLAGLWLRLLLLTRSSSALAAVHSPQALCACESRPWRKATTYAAISSATTRGAGRISCANGEIDDSFLANCAFAFFFFFKWLI